jgi:hypothetical protein
VNLDNVEAFVSMLIDDGFIMLPVQDDLETSKKMFEYYDKLAKIFSDYIRKLNVKSSKKA